jgi:hypothetical protein
MRRAGRWRYWTGRRCSWRPGDILKHLLEIHEAHDLGLLDIDRRDDAVHPDLFVGNPGFVGRVKQFHAQGGPFVLIPRQALPVPTSGR